ncbi:filamin-A-like isoform X2 [Littorina saxatilis]|uniref:Calponin-homology (CH) domain-containing protein n=1 Tax=Littorina saxatilis TaxID=31220 RepID=A0AAN9BB56_9CAEN
MHANDEREADFEDEEMSTAERELADDAQWKIIQKNTFTRWANEHLKTVNKALADLESDFSDGLRLLALIEVLSGKKFKHVNKRPNFRTQKLENVTMTLKFLEEDEGIRIVNIDSTDIVDKKLKLILGLIWTLILHYSISMPMWEGEEPTPSEGGPTPKQRLLNWIQSKVPDMPIKNFTTDWNDGRAIGALVDAVGPGLCPDWEDWNPKNGKNNAKEAMDAAEKWLDVPQLIKPDEMTNPKVDDLSMMTYLSQFPNAKLKPGAPTRPRVNPARVRAYGPGLEPKGNQVGAPARFTVETFSAGKGALEVMVLNPKGAKENCESVFNNDRNMTYSCVYVPTMEGEFRVIIKFASKEIAKSPFKVTVEGAAGDATKVTAKGPGIEKTGVVATKKTYFEVYTKGAGNGKVDVVILDPHGRKDTIRPSIQPVVGKECTFLVEYVPIDQGLHSVNVFFAGSQIPHSPFGVQVAPPSNAKACYASGRGIQPRGIRVKDEADFYVHTKGAGEGDVSVQIIGPGGSEEKCKIRKLPDQPDVYECIYIPLKPGHYIINVTYGDQHISKSPFKVEVGPFMISKIVAYGPGLTGGVVNQPAIFTVETNGETGALGFSIEGPSQAKIDCKDNGDGSADVTYWPTLAGEYAVHILCNEQDIPKSPYMADIKPAADFNAGKVIAKGPGLEKTGVMVNKWAEFTVDAKLAGKAVLNITCVDVEYKTVEVQVKDNRDGTYSCRYNPSRNCKHTIIITYGHVCVPGSPFRVYVAEPSQPSKVKVHGPGVSPGVKTNSKTFFIVDCTQAGPGDVAVGLTDERGVDVPIKTIDNKDGTFRVEYEAMTPGMYTVMVYFAEKQIPQSPIKVKIESSIDVSGITVEGLQPKMPMHQQHIATIRIPPRLPKAQVKMMITSPSGKVTEVPIQDQTDKKIAPFTLKEPGHHKIEVTYGGCNVKDSPFKVEAYSGPLVGSMCKVKAYGPGLTTGDTTAPAVFTIDSRDETKPGQLSVVIKGPKEPKMDIKDNKDGTCTVTYFPEVPGEYKIHITHAQIPIIGSAFTAKIKQGFGPSGGGPPKVKAYGPGLTGGEANKPATFTVDARAETRPGNIAVNLEGPKPTPVDIKDNGDGTCVVTYVPELQGEYKIHISHGERPIMGSPFKAKIKPGLGTPIGPGTAPKVKAFGPGLTGGEAKSPANFTIDAREETQPGALGVTVQGPKEPKIDTKDNGDGTCAVSYLPEVPGDYKVNVTHANKPIPGSPFKAKIMPQGQGPPKVTASGPGLTGGEANALAPFTIDSREETRPGDIAVKVSGPKQPKVDVKDNKDGTSNAYYLPEVPGDYTIAVTHGNKPIPGSPFKANIKPSTAKLGEGPPKVKAYGPGLTGGEANAIATFTLDSREETRPGDLGVKVTGPKEPKVDVKDNGDGTSSVFYLPEVPGDYTVAVTHANKPIPMSPFKAKIKPSTSRPGEGPPKVKAYGPGLNGGEANALAPFTIDSREETRPGGIGVKVRGPREPKVDVKDNKDGTDQAFYLPEVPGDYVVDVTHANKPIPGSPFKAKVVPSTARPGDSPPKVKAYGPGLNGGEANTMATFTIDSREETRPGGLGVTMSGPKEPKIDIKDNQDGTCSVFYTPEVPGDYKINVTHGNKPIPGAPFKPKIKPSTSRPNEGSPKVKAYGPGLGGGEAYKPATFTIDTREESRPGGLGVTVEGPKESKIDVKDNGDGTCAVAYLPEVPGDYKVNVTHANKPIPGSPFKAKIKPGTGAPGAPSEGAPKVKAYGPGLTAGEASKPAVFTIDTRDEPRPGGLGVTVEGPKEAKIDCRDNGNGTCAVSYVPDVPGDYKVNVTHDNKPIPGSPFTAKIKPAGSKPAGLDVGAVTAYGPGLNPDGVFIEAPTEFTVDARAVTPNGEGKVEAILTTPTGRRMQTVVDNKKDGTYPVLYTPTEQGPQQLDVTYEGIPIPGSPFKVQAVPGNDANKVRAYGPGLKGGITNQPAKFTVDMKGAGKGGLGLGIEGPVEAKMNCKDNRDGTCEVEYMPTKPGNYDIAVTFADKPIPDSPFRVRISNPVDASKVKCYGPGLDSKGVTAGAPADFTIDAREAGDAPLQVTYTDQTGATFPAEVVPVEEGLFQATYKPTAEGKCKVDVQYGGKEVPNSPFSMRVLPGVDPSKVKVTGPGVQGTTPASMPAKFTVDTKEAGVADLECVVQRPDGTFIRPYIQDNGDGTFDVAYTPEDLGVYDVIVKYAGQDVPGAPFPVKATPTGDASKCKITDGADKTVPVNKETFITVDAAEAGSGKVTCRIRSPNGSDIDIDIIDKGDGTFTIAFTPQFPGDYTIEIKFGGNMVPNGDYTIQAVSEEEYEEYLQNKVDEDLIAPDSVDSLRSAAPGSGLFKPVDFCFQVGPIFNFVSAAVVMPSGKTAYPKIEDNRDGTVTVRYQPTETGLHELHVKYNNEPIDGSPFLFHVDSVNSGYVTAYGPGLSHGTVHEPAYFTINTKEAGAGGLSLAVEGPSKTEIKCVDNQDGTCTVSYMPTVPGEYLITVKFADKNIMGSPFTAKITPGEPKKRAQLSVGSSSEVSLKVTETDISDLTASIKSPTGREEPCLLKRLANGHLGITFTPRETGEHLVNVYRNGKHIANSPFKIVVGESELGNASKVKVSGKGLKEGMANEVNEFIVDTREAGYGGMSLSIEGPSKADIECHDNEDGTCRVTYKPTEPGTYIINIKFADQHVPGSPFTVKIGGEPSAKITERITRHKAAADVTHVGSECELSLKIPGTSPFDMTASVKSPSGLTELCDIVSLDDNHYSIKFVPKEMGVHTVSVKHKEMHIPGSPFQFTVGPIAGGGSHKVHAAGPGLERGEVKQPCDFNIYTREAGAGGLSIAVEGPSKAEIDFQDRKDGSCGVTYVVSEPGEYYVSIKFNDEHIPESPFRVPITPSIGDARKISIQALQDKGLTVNKPAAFIVNFNGAKGKLTATVVSPSGAQEEALVQEVDDGQYAVRFIPRENGLHYVEVLFDGYHIPDSPFRIMVGKVDAADAGKVTAFGDGLHTGTTGQISKFIVNTVNAGAGALAVTVEGPSKVKLECREVDEGYEFTYCPKAPGDYLITIRYAGVNIAGSPFKARVEGSGQASAVQEHASVVVETVTKTSTTTKFSGIAKFSSDATKCVAKGNGLTKAFRGKTTSFTVDTTGAGNNILYVGMKGPKSPVDELTVKFIGNNQYTINYTVKQQGQYILIVRWGEEDIPGSPFAVEVI